MVGSFHSSLGPRVQTLLAVLKQAGGTPYVVGGAVRDHFLGRQPKDVDVEVFGLWQAVVERVLEGGPGFKVDSVGKSFGVLKVTVEDGIGVDETIDVALPRTERKTSAGHQGFVTERDPNLSFEQAAARRDFTINAIGYNAVTDRFEDPYGGVRDLEHGILRHVGPAFAEDPLRVMRACQFVARFKLTMHPDTVLLCRSLVDELKTLPMERLWVEWKKLLDCPGGQPSLGLNALVATGAIALFPELMAMLHVQQDETWHPEGQGHPLGSLWVHNCMVTDSALRVLTDDDVKDSDERLIIMLGALCHDLGKPATTKFEDGRWRSLKHEEAGAEPTRLFTARIGAPVHIIDSVVPLVKEHLKPFHLARDKASPSAVRRLSMRAPLERLCRVARADFLGRTTPDALATTDSRDIAETKWLLAKAAELKVDPFHGMEPLLKGRHLIGLGVKPGPVMGDMLKEALEAQLEGAFEDEDGAVNWIAARIGFVGGSMLRPKEPPPDVPKQRA